jgi:hypothetical protein
MGLAPSSYRPLSHDIACSAGDPVRTHRAAVCAVILVLSVTGASAQVKSPLNITSEEEAVIYSTLTQGSLKQQAPAAIKLNLGAKVPATIELYEVPVAVPAPVHSYRYTVHSNRVYIVDPETRRVVRIIPNR